MIANTDFYRVLASCRPERSRQLERGIHLTIARRAFLCKSCCRTNGRVGVVAQLVERLVRNQQVRGSNPLGSTILRSEPTLGGFERRMVSSVALAKEDFSP